MTTNVGVTYIKISVWLPNHVNEWISVKHTEHTLTPWQVLKENKKNRHCKQLRFELPYAFLIYQQSVNLITFGLCNCVIETKWMSGYVVIGIFVISRNSLGSRLYFVNELIVEISFSNFFVDYNLWQYCQKNLPVREINKQILWEIRMISWGV